MTQSFYNQGPGKSIGWELEVREFLPPIENDTKSSWKALRQEYVSNVRGEETGAYLTFCDGIYLLLILNMIVSNENT
jgi:hypothetical protein